MFGFIFVIMSFSSYNVKKNKLQVLGRNYII
jgi:hypothetical protein